MTNHKTNDDLGFLKKKNDDLGCLTPNQRFR